MKKFIDLGDIIGLPNISKIAVIHYSEVYPSGGDWDDMRDKEGNISNKVELPIRASIYRIEFTPATTSLGYQDWDRINKTIQAVHEEYMSKKITLAEWKELDID